MRAVQKYLDQHAEPEARAIWIGDARPDFQHESGVGGVPGGANQTPFEHAVVIPSFAEGRGILRTLDSLVSAAAGQPTVVFVVLNAKEDATNEQHHANEETREALSAWSHSEVPENAEPPTKRSVVVHLIDRAKPGSFLPERQGVGLARKIGCDLALAGICRGSIDSGWICSTDADASVPRDYFNMLPKLDQEVAAALHPFEHTFDVDEAILLYECFLRYQRLGLRAAGSSYAFHTVGSTISVRPDAYAKVRGMPKRMAGEDFYFLNKLSKVGPIEELSGPPIELDSRTSDRVPFGTGRAMGILRSGGASTQTYGLPDPRTFELLGRWIEATRNACDAGAQNERPFSRALSRETLRQNFEQLISDAREQVFLRDVLSEQDAFAQIAQLLTEGRSPSDRIKRVDSWFDGFRTMKFLHGLRDHAFPDLPFQEAIESAPFVSDWKPGRGPERVELARLRDHLQRLENRRVR